MKARTTWVPVFKAMASSGRILYMRAGCVLLALYSTWHEAEPGGHRAPVKSCEVPAGSQPLLGFGWAGLNGWAGWRSKSYRGWAGLMGVWMGHAGERFWGREREQAAGKLLSWCLVCMPCRGGRSSGHAGAGWASRGSENQHKRSTARIDVKKGSSMLNTHHSFGSLPEERS